MIHLIENYYAEPNNMGFTLMKIEKKKDEEGNPKESIATLGYCGNFENTVFLLKRKMVDQRLKRGSMELSEALEVIRNTTEEIKQAIEGKLTTP